MYAELALSLSTGRDKTLTTRAKRLRELFESESTDSPARLIAKFSNFTEATPEGNLMQVFSPEGVRLYPPESWPAVPFPWPPNTANKRTLSKAWYSGRQFRVLSEPVSIRSVRYRFQVAGQLEDNRAILSRFASTLVWAAPVLLIVSAIGGYSLSRRALKPVAELIASARSISIGNLRGRLPISHTGDELQMLAATCNEMLARVESSVNRITRFTADASHELRTPIAYIRTVSEYALRDPNLDADSAESFRDIVRESEEAARLLEDMLTLARADAGQAGIGFATIDLRAILFQTFRRAQPLAEARGHRLSMNPGPDEEALISGDTSSLRRLLWILVDNAIRYTPAGGQVTLTLRLAAGKALVSVQDSGVGIPPAALPHIFDRFYRVEGNRTTEEGTGLGLAIAKWIADIHHANIGVQSIEGEGTTFQVSFVRLGAPARYDAA